MVGSEWDNSLQVRRLKVNLLEIWDGIGGHFIYNNEFNYKDLSLVNISTICGRLKNKHKPLLKVYKFIVKINSLLLIKTE
jgi:hypothetical protein